MAKFMNPRRIINVNPMKGSTFTPSRGRHAFFGNNNNNRMMQLFASSDDVEDDMMMMEEEEEEENNITRKEDEEEKTPADDVYDSFHLTVATWLMAGNRTEQLIELYEKYGGTVDKGTRLVCGSEAASAMVRIAHKTAKD
eukprot:CAMPEP_0194150732 /NCGR_PEP_ID=MMETSP0152-20130528/44910_1 /TAXON_ID=1049557 /ORGANISM="Thalassiothrix antarctica, Strain L6-D1" /LENGTH=139 /DNA_ID=CAMNT_0038853943 /DNA_START=29 /DNA_END=445 /DNA_ORIENTATION=+